MLVLHRVLTDDCLAFLANADHQIVHALAATLAGVEREGPLADLVYAADRDSVERDLRTFGNLLSQVGLRVPLEQYLIDAMRRLLRGGQWTVNQPGARVWVLPEGVHLVWRAAAGEIIDLLSTEQVAGIPRDPDTLADILVERGLAVPRPLSNGGSFRYWLITPLLLDHPARLYTLRLADPTVLFSTGIVPPPLQARFLDADSTAPPQEAEITTGGDRPTWLRTATPMAEAPSANHESLDSALAPPSMMASTTSLVSPASEQAAVTPLSPAEPAAITLPLSLDSEQARHWLHQQGPAGHYLLQVIERLRTHQDDVLSCSEPLALAYPESLAELELPPVQVLTLLAEARLLELDPLLPAQRRVRDIDTPAGPRKGVVLTSTAAACVQALIGIADNAPVGVQPTAAGLSTIEPVRPTGPLRELPAYFWRERHQLPFAAEVREQRLYLPYREALRHYATHAGVSFSKLVILIQQAPAAAITTQREEQGLLLVMTAPDRL